MNNLYIIGARGCGREVYNFFKECQSHMQDFECVGFLDDYKSALDEFKGYPPIVSSVEEYEPKANDRFICALGDPKWVKHYTSIIENKGGIFISLISQGASIGKNTIIGDGCIIPGWTVISSDIIIGRHVYLGVFSDIGHDAVIENCCHLGAYTFLGGGVHVEECSTLHPRASVVPHKKIGAGAVVGAGSVVVKNVQANTTVFGIPAKRIT